MKQLEDVFLKQKILADLNRIMKSDYYILDGREPMPVKMLEWAQWFEQRPQDRILAQDILRPWVRVSTVFLGLNHAFGHSEKPVLFETLVFGGKHNGQMFRYCEFDDAIVQHQALVRDLMKIERVPRRWRARIERRLVQREDDRLVGELDALCPREIEIPERLLEARL